MRVTMTTTKIERLDVRLLPADKNLVEQAAAVQGQSVSAFTVATLREKAQEVLAKAQATLLTRRDLELFSKILDSEEAPNAALRAAARRLKRARG
jgi:uncharacterized protein (DUF1778 family)